jgi:hypothetical protein
MFMIISSTVDSPPYAPDTGFRTAGWLTIIGIFVTLVDVVIAIMSLTNPNLKPLYLARIPLIILRVSFEVYVFVQLKRLLNERYDIHEANGIITGMIVLDIAWGVDAMMIFPFVGLPPSGFLAIFHNVIAALLFLTLFGILGIILGVYLLRVREDTSGLFRIFAILYIITSSCMATVLLSTIAMFPGVVASVILAILFFRAAEAEPQVEFV